MSPSLLGKLNFHPGEKHPDLIAGINACFNMRHDILVKGE